MVSVIKLLGVERSATTYCQWLIVNNFDNVIVTVAALGGKHYMLPDYFHTIDWVDGTAPPQKELVDKVISGLKQEIGKNWSARHGIPWDCTPKRAKSCAHTSTHAEKHVKKALEMSSIKFVLCTKNPYSWFLSSLRRFKPKNKKHSRERLIRERVGGWVRRNKKWLEFYEKNEQVSFIFKYEDVLANHTKILTQLEQKLKLTKIDENYKDVAKYFLSSGKLTAKRFDRTYYTKQKFMGELSQKDIKIFEDVLPKDLMDKLGYEIYQESEVAKRPAQKQIVVAETNEITKATKSWEERLKEIRNHLKNDKVSNFKQWGVIKQTMLVSEAKYNDFFQILEEHVKWPSYKQIIEFGAGFGCLCKMIFENGFGGTYYTFDFPELLQLQKHYLEGLNVKFTNNFHELPTIQDDSLFISVNALEEAPQNVSKRMFEYIMDCRDFIFKFCAGSRQFSNFSNSVDREWISIKNFANRAHILIGKRK